MDDRSTADRPEDVSATIRFEYAWNWFQYHASQRLTAFNFFLILVGLISVSYVQAVEHGWIGVGVAIGVLGALVSFGFWALDIRNEELIACGWNALLEIEKSTDVNIVSQGDVRARLADAIGSSPLHTGLLGRVLSAHPSTASVFKHRTWLRLIMSVTGFVFVAGAVWAASHYPGSTSVTGRHSDDRPPLEWVKTRSG